MVLGSEQSSILITCVYFSKRLIENPGMAILGDRACCFLLFVLVGYLKQWFSNSLVCTGGSHTAGTIRTRVLLAGRASPLIKTQPQGILALSRQEGNILVRGDSLDSSLVPAGSKWAASTGRRDLCVPVTSATLGRVGSVSWWVITIPSCDISPASSPKQFGQELRSPVDASFHAADASSHSCQALLNT